MCFCCFLFGILHYPQIVDQFQKFYQNEKLTMNQNHSFQIVCDFHGRNFVIKINGDIDVNFYNEKNDDSKQNEDDHQQSDAHIHHDHEFIKFIELQNVDCFGGKSLVQIEKNDSEYDYFIFHGCDSNEFHQLNCMTRKWESFHLPQNLTHITHAFAPGCVALSSCPCFICIFCLFCAENQVSSKFVFLSRSIFHSCF